MQQSSRLGEHRLLSQQLLAHTASEVERRLLSSAISTHVLGTAVLHGLGNIEDFEILASTILRQHEAVHHVRLEPNGVVTRVYPEEGNTSYLDNNVFLDDDRLGDAMTAIATQSVALSQPFRLAQGDLAVVASTPVFLPMEKNQPGSDIRFWGFASAVIKIDMLFEDAGLERITKHGFGYQISQSSIDIEDPGIMATHVLSQSDFDTSHSLHTVDIDVPNSTWQLTISSRNTLLSPVLLLELTLALLFALSVAAYCRRIVVEPDRLRKLVDSQTVRLNKLAYEDGLTGLANRTQFLSSVEYELVVGNRPILLLLDLDHFKDVNDTLGHDVGDLLLCAASQRIADCLSKNVLLARLGGDEFTALVSGEARLNTAIRAAERIVNSINEPFLINGNEIRISTSIGIAESNASDDDVTRLLKRADQAMYRAKHDGRARLSVFTADMEAAAQHRMRLTHDLKIAVTEGKLDLAFQPIVCASTNEVHKAEALIRWTHPELGPISPMEFIPLAEESGLIQEIGDWVFRQSAKTVRDWRARFRADFQISVNVSPIQFRNRDTLTEWVRTVDELGIAPDSILVEITENVLLDGTEQLDALRHAGFPVALDDFGTGYCSLSYLKKLSIDYLKIDRSFVNKLQTDQNDVALCRAIIALARQFNLKVVAEGVETNEQRDLLVTQTCDFMQGYLYSKPIPRQEFEAAFLSGHPDRLDRAA